MEKEAKKTIFTPVIQNSKVIQLTINGNDIKLKEEITIGVFTEKLLPLLLELEKFFDLNDFTIKKEESKKITLKGWDKSSFEEFWLNLSENQREIIRFISLKEQISRSDIINQLINKKLLEQTDQDLTKKLAGIVAGITRRWNTLGFEPIWYINRSVYSINPKLKYIIEDKIKRE